MIDERAAEIYGGIQAAGGGRTFEQGVDSRAADPTAGCVIVLGVAFLPLTFVNSQLVHHRSTEKRVRRRDPFVFVWLRLPRLLQRP